MTYSCFGSEEKTSRKKLRKKPLLHWPNFTWARSQDTIHKRLHHYQRSHSLRIQFLRHNRSFDSDQARLARKKAQRNRPVRSFEPPSRPALTSSPPPIPPKSRARVHFLLEEPPLERPASELLPATLLDYAHNQPFPPCSRLSAGTATI